MSRPACKHHWPEASAGASLGSRVWERAAARAAALTGAARSRIRGRAIGVCLAAALAASSSAPAFADPPAPAPATDNALATICGIVETAAKSEGLPVNFFTRLIWRESAFHPGAVSPAGAQGVAQFMPGTASERGLADPFDPAAAIPASAKLLADLAQRFGNLGLAAAAYNAGANAVADWLAGHGSCRSRRRTTSSRSPAMTSRNGAA